MISFQFLQSLDIKGETKYFATHFNLICFVAIILWPRRRKIDDVISIV